MDAATLDRSAEAEIRGRVQSWLKAFRASDLAGIMVHYAPDVVAFDAILRLEFKGKEAYGKHWEACLAMCPGTVIAELRDLRVVAAEGVAFGHGLIRCGTIDPAGNEKSGWMRLTVGWRRFGGRWLVVHEHFSVPFDVESGKALLGLEP